MANDVADQIVKAAKRLSKQMDSLSFDDPVSHVYNPLDYAWKPHERYLQTYAKGSCRVLLLGMNPGPWGMAQTGVPFGEIEAVRSWLQIEEEVRKPQNEHPKRPIEGFDCAKSEVSGRRLWGLFSERYPDPHDFFRDHFILNYCPLVFMEASARNVTPDKLPKDQRELMEAHCDAHLAEIIRILEPEFAIGVGAWAEKCLKRSITEDQKLGKILHPSPASPAANKGWAEKAALQLQELGIW